MGDSPWYNIAKKKIDEFGQQIQDVANQPLDPVKAADYRNSLKYPQPPAAPVVHEYKQGVPQPGAAAQGSRLTPDEADAQFLRNMDAIDRKQQEKAMAAPQVVDPAMAGYQKRGGSR